MPDPDRNLATPDANKPQPLPALPREALNRIEQAEKEARERYNRDILPYFPMNPEFSFLEHSIFGSIERILEYIRIFAEEILDASLREYHDCASSHLLTNEALLQSVARNVWRLTDELWSGYGYILQFEPTSRRAQLQTAMAEGTIHLYPHLQPSLYPPQEWWADFLSRMAEPDSEMARLNKQYEATIKLTIKDRIRRYQRQAASKLQTEPGVIQTLPQGISQGGRAPSPEDTQNADELAQSQSVGVADDGTDYEQVEYGEKRARTVAKLIEELGAIRPGMYEEQDYQSRKTQHPDFLVFKIAEEHPDLQKKIIYDEFSRRSIRLAQELAAAFHGIKLSTIQTDWKKHKPAEFRQQKRQGRKRGKR